MTLLFCTFLLVSKRKLFSVPYQKFYDVFYNNKELVADKNCMSKSLFQSCFINIFIFQILSGLLQKTCLDTMKCKFYLCFHRFFTFVTSCVLSNAGRAINQEYITNHLLSFRIILVLISSVKKPVLDNGILFIQLLENLLVINSILRYKGENKVCMKFKTVVV